MTTPVLVSHRLDSAHALMLMIGVFPSAEGLLALCVYGDGFMDTYAVGDLVVEARNLDWPIDGGFVRAHLDEQEALVR